MWLTIKLELNWFCDLQCDSFMALGPLRGDSDSEYNNNVKNACASDVNSVPIKRSNKRGDGALFNYGDALIVSASPKVGMTKCITVRSLPS